MVFYGILQPVETTTGLDFEALYASIDAPITAYDCGKKCAPYNDHRVPFCCDTNHIVPTAYIEEWDYLETHTNLWHPHESDDIEIDHHLQSGIPEGQVLIECLGHKECQRNFRTIACRAFPFAPYITGNGQFIGFTYYWQYEDLCWVISHLDKVTNQYRDALVTAYERIFDAYPGEFHEFKYFSNQIRQIFIQQRRAITLLHRNGFTYKISPHNERKRRIDARFLPKYGPYKVASAMPFPDEIADISNG